MPTENRTKLKRWFTPYTAVWDTQTSAYATHTVGSLRALSSNPKWQTLVLSGKDATNPYTNTKYVFYKVPGLCWAKPKPGYPPLSRRRWSYVDGGCPDPIAASAALKSRAKAYAATACIKKIRARQMAYDGLTLIGELRETIQMLRSPARSLRDAMHKVKQNAETHRNLFPSRMRDRDRVRWEQVLADLWLEFSFGVQPVINDIHDISVAALNVGDLGNTRFSRVRGVGSDTEGVRYSKTYGTLIGANWITEEVHRQRAFAKYTVGIKETSAYDTSALNRVLASGGFTLSNVVPALWELTPWSFLVDYFVNVGDVLATHFTSLRDVAWSSLTTVTDETIVWGNSRLVGVTDLGATTYWGERKPEYNGCKTVITRSKELPSASLNALRVTIPALDSRKWLNIAALATGVFNKPSH